MAKMAIIPQTQHNRAEEKREQQWLCNWALLQSTPAPGSFPGMQPPVWATPENSSVPELVLC